MATETAFLNQDYIRGTADAMETGKRFEDPRHLQLLRATPLEVGGWFHRVWRVGEIEGRIDGKCDAFVPLERLSSRQIFGARGEEVGAIIEAILSLTEDDLLEIERRIAAEPSLVERDLFLDGYPSVQHVMSGQSVVEAIDRRATAIDPTSYTDEEFPYSRDWHRAVWPQIEGVAYDAVEVLALSDDEERAKRSYRRVIRPCVDSRLQEHDPGVVEELASLLRCEASDVGARKSPRRRSGGHIGADWPIAASAPRPPTLTRLRSCLPQEDPDAAVHGPP